ncbi:clavesin-1-like isoform X5 [Uranotaenia lowii]|uniref:clavesin-1-like isoform X5 n=1 Tax=Uranotaenia lowii TaxID=190385 RepID=UPI002479CC4B|nr:clavesin-1-like isoform X5 [Uranotaenia lowii]
MIKVSESGRDLPPSEEYHCSLEPEDLKVAREELNEYDHVRDQAMEQMREYIAKHPQFRNCWTEPLFLLRFLRYRKFNVVAACEFLEKWLIGRVEARDFCVVDNPDGLTQLIDQAMIVPLGKDSQNRVVTVIRCGHYDPALTTPEQVTQLGTLAVEVFADDERFQVHGLIAILDLGEFSMAHLGRWTFTKLKTVMTAARDILPFRVKEVHLVRMPIYLTSAVDFCLNILSSKLQFRVKFHKSIDDLKAAIDESVLPDIYGGKQSLEEANERFRQKVLEQRERILKHAEMTIDLSIPNPNSKNPANAALQSSVVDESVIGSFRKLNVD